MVDFISILRIDTLNSDIDIRLPRQQPDIAHHHIGKHHVVHRHRIGAASLHLGQVYAPAAIRISYGSILVLVPANDYFLLRVGFSPYGDCLSTL